MQRFRIIIYIFFISGILLSSGLTSYKERKSELSNDSLLILGLKEQVRSSMVRGRLQELIEEIEFSKRLFKPFPIDVYKAKKFKYICVEKLELSLYELLEMINDRIEIAKIIRINKLNLKNEKHLNFADNTYKFLDKNPQYREKEFLIDLLENTILNSDKKSSIEWIWGKSYENNAYYSTKLTVFDEQITLYPDYRVFIGDNSMRDKTGWFYSLLNYTHIKPDIVQNNTIETTRDIEEYDNENVVLNADTVSVSEGRSQTDNITLNEDGQNIANQEFNCGTSADFQFDTLKDDVKLNGSIYKKDEAGNYASENFTDLNLKKFTSDHLKNTVSISVIKFSGTDYEYSEGSVKQITQEEYIEVTDDIRICSEKIKSFLSDALLFPDKKRSIELITGRNKSKLSYFATVITVYDGQTTVFYNYKIAAHSNFRKDKESWFNKLVVSKN